MKSPKKVADNVELWCYAANKYATCYWFCEIFNSSKNTCWQILLVVRETDSGRSKTFMFSAKAAVPDMHVSAEDTAKCKNSIDAEQCHQKILQQKYVRRSHRTSMLNRKMEPECFSAFFKFSWLMITHSGTGHSELDLLDCQKKKCFNLIFMWSVLGGKFFRWQQTWKMFTGGG